ncbi:MAG TPA: alkaline phosphatase family protein [Gemmatimonadota bacterium]|nr:alkaline phosphatase family protein [Gemmatimonadota bacterium]
MSSRWYRLGRLASIAVLFAACAHTGERTGPPPSPTRTERPALVVMLVVDQLSQVLLARHADVFSGGFRRRIDDGRWYVNATHDHAGTVTAAGHATLSTGTWPSHHGIVANEWHEKIDEHWVEVSNVGDSTVQILDNQELEGVSPRHLMRTGLADWMVAADPRTLVASISPKDRGAVQPAAHAPGQVYWFDNDVGRFVTSTYYRDRYPEWVERFNAEVMAALSTDTLWTSTVPPTETWRSDPDTAAHEGDEASPYFPHRFGDPRERSDFWEWFERTPMLDAATLDLARIAVAETGLGRDSIPDFLNVSLSQTDRIGHDFGPLSREQLDNLLRLDRELGDFFAFLDSTVGEGRWIAGLSADHGVLVTGQDMRVGEQESARRWTPEEERAVAAIYAENAGSADSPESPERIARALERLDFVADAYTHAELMADEPADSFAVLERRSLYPGRAREDFSPLGVEVRYDPWFLDRELGSGHGTPYWYDRNVPMIFMGPGIPPGRDATRASTTDFAPTLARLLGIPYPEDVDGSPLAGVNGPGASSRQR